MRESSTAREAGSNGASRMTTEVSKSNGSASKVEATHGNSRLESTEGSNSLLLTNSDSDILGGSAATHSANSSTFSDVPILSASVAASHQSIDISTVLPGDERARAPLKP